MTGGRQPHGYLRLQNRKLNRPPRTKNSAPRKKPEGFTAAPGALLKSPFEFKTTRSIRPLGQQRLSPPGENGSMKWAFLMAMKSKNQCPMAPGHLHDEFRIPPPRIPLPRRMDLLRPSAISPTTSPTFVVLPRRQGPPLQPARTLLRRIPPRRPPGHGPSTLAANKPRPPTSSPTKHFAFANPAAETRGDLASSTKSTNGPRRLPP